MYRRYRVEIELIEKLLGTQPQDAKAREYLEHREDEEVPPGPPGKTTFYFNEGRPVIMDFEVKGFFKEAAITLPKYLGVEGRRTEYPGTATIRGYIDRWLFVQPRHIFMADPNGVIKDRVDGVLGHFIRGMTRLGQRISPIDSDYMAEGTRAAFTVSVLEGCAIKEEAIKTWLAYGEEGIGLLLWRTAGFGRFKVIGFAEVKREQGEGMAQ